MCLILKVLRHHPSCFVVVCGFEFVALPVGLITCSHVVFHLNFNASLWNWFCYNKGQFSLKYLQRTPLTSPHMMMLWHVNALFIAGPLWRESTSIWCFLCSQPEEAIEETIELLWGVYFEYSKNNDPATIAFRSIHLFHDIIYFPVCGSSSATQTLCIMLWGSTWIQICSAPCGVYYMFTCCVLSLLIYEMHALGIGFVITRHIFQMVTL